MKIKYVGDVYPDLNGKTFTLTDDDISVFGGRIRYCGKSYWVLWGDCEKVYDTTDASSIGGA